MEVKNVDEWLSELSNKQFEYCDRFSVVRLKDYEYFWMNDYYFVKDGGENRYVQLLGFHEDCRRVYINNKSITGTIINNIAPEINDIWKY